MCRVHVQCSLTCVHLGGLTEHAPCTYHPSIHCSEQLACRAMQPGGGGVHQKCSYSLSFVSIISHTTPLAIRGGLAIPVDRERLGPLHQQPGHTQVVDATHRSLHALCHQVTAQAGHLPGDQCMGWVGVKWEGREQDRASNGGHSASLTSQRRPCIPSRCIHSTAVWALKCARLS